MDFCSKLDYVISWGFLVLAALFFAFSVLILVKRITETKHIDRVSWTAIGFILMEVGVLYFRGNYLNDPSIVQSCGDPLFRFISMVGHGILLAVLSWDYKKPAWAMSLIVAAAAMMLSYIWIG